MGENELLNLPITLIVRLIGGALPRFAADGLGARLGCGSHAESFFDLIHFRRAITVRQYSSISVGYRLLEFRNQWGVYVRLANMISFPALETIWA